MSTLEATVEAVAARLNDIATNVASEAALLTRTIRQIEDHTRLISGLAVDLEEAADQIDQQLQAQFAVIVSARAGFASYRPALTALDTSVDLLTSMSARVREIAYSSRLLSLNAQIEAARSDTGGAFTAVAAEMGNLAKQTRTTTDEIDSETTLISANVGKAGTVIQAGMKLLEQQHDALGSVASAATGQRTVAGQMLKLTAETVEQVDDAALGIGRVASAASIVGVIARQMTNAAQSANNARGED